MSSDSGCLLGGLIGVLIVVVLFGWLFDAAWLYKSFYVLNDDVSWDRVYIEKKPHDCEFMTAPFGAKNCHYEKAVTIIKWATRNGDGFPIRSFDDGKTWEAHIPGKCESDPSLDCPNVYDPPNNVAPKYITVTGVSISWKKVQD